MSALRERHWPFVTPGHKRKYAQGMKDTFLHERYETWMALADCQEAGRLEEYHEARKRWQEQEPHPREFT